MAADREAQLLVERCHHWVPYQTRRDGLRLHSPRLSKLVEQARSEARVATRQTHVQVRIIPIVGQAVASNAVLKMRSLTPVGDLFETWCDLHHVDRDMWEFVHRQGATRRVLADHDTPQRLGWTRAAIVSVPVVEVEAWMLAAGLQRINENDYDIMEEQSTQCPSVSDSIEFSMSTLSSLSVRSGDILTEDSSQTLDFEAQPRTPSAKSDASTPVSTWMQKLAARKAALSH
mmetsp:Transcript_73194/g.136789  ORF Transcript_73194/g.136789 Transcript_73194/m.136789 type:complete len:231 (+) Transcript_73194:139-831(+)